MCTVNLDTHCAMLKLLSNKTVLSRNAKQNDNIYSMKNSIHTRCQKLATWKWSLLHRRRCRKNTRAESRNRDERCLSKSRPGCHQETEKHHWGWRTQRHQCSYNMTNMWTETVSLAFNNKTTSYPCCVLHQVFTSKCGSYTPYEEFVEKKTQFNQDYNKSLDK